MGEANEVRSGYMVVYTDHGPGGLCGQSMSITCPHAYVSIFDSYDEAKTAIEANGGKIGRGGLRRNIVQGEINGGPIRLFDHRPADAELARVAAERDRLRAACETMVAAADRMLATGSKYSGIEHSALMKIRAALAGEGGSNG